MLPSPRLRAAALALVSLLACVLPGAATAQARPLYTGVSGVGSSESAAYDEVTQAGAKFVHIAVTWALVAPRQQPASWHPADPGDPDYDWADVDARVLAARQHGLTPVLLIDGAPGWAQRCVAPAPLQGHLCDPDPEALAAFATAAASRYSGTFAGLPRVRFWQGLNEPNLSLFFNPQFEGGRAVSPELYRTLINRFYEAIKAVDATNLVLAAGLGPIARPGSTVGPMRFVRQLLCMKGRRKPRPSGGNCDGGVHFDIFDMHPYTTGGPTHEGGVDDVQLGDLDKLRELIDAANRAGRIEGRFNHTPIWVTEFSWDTKPPDPGGLPMKTAQRWVAQALFEAWSAGVDHFFWYSLRDSPTGDLPYNQTVQSGLYFRGATIAADKPKPIRQAFRFPFVAFTDGEGFGLWGRTPTSKGGRVQIQVQEGGRWLTLGTVRADGAGIFRGHFDRPAGKRRSGFVRARYGREIAVPFSLHAERDHYQPPFG